ncbi:HAD family hydrolase [Kitasatospora purpeofusca]|uniref:HAD family hydrolase n=1 Tax=Kitasatospora purpeofusca TaxID=67352 RepID=UPI0022533121|nr:HAD family hydrolase [Kitasatospora purpeofusca]MCX4754410.1 HAD family hydrolase [Kitasatospora purpeofusca]WSR33834.1 HAD family hydrolase [Kitasatospora purpeofusca]WSR42050.1 HAD family hydrolase [Kitasatospora purpeofusca]
MPVTSDAPLTVGFDLDMTLLDTRPGIRATYLALSAETGTAIDADLVVTRLGPPLLDELRNWFPAEELDAVAHRYRTLYRDHAFAPTVALPGAHAALDAVRAHGGRVAVITGKYEPNARLHLDHADLRADALVGDLWAETKGVALREHGATVYVGDHLGDIRGAKHADAVAVGVATGPYGAEDLLAAGADVVLPDLTAFPAWLDGHLAGR